MRRACRFSHWLPHVNRAIFVSTVPATDEPAATSPTADLPPVRSVAARRRVVVELAAVAVLYAGYTASRNAIGATHRAAVRDGQSLLRAEQLIHLDPERTVNHAVALHPLVAQLCDYDYAIAHFAVTLPVLALLYWRRRAAARRLAAVWFLTNLLALVVFFTFPVAPPRLLPHAGFVDTVVVFHTWGSWGSGAVASASNQYAAMPSLHVAWAVWSAIAIWSITRRLAPRLLALAYPVVTVVVVVATANHYVLDTLAGALVVGLAFAIVTTFVGLSEHVAAGRQECLR